MMKLSLFISVQVSGVVRKHRESDRTEKISMLVHYHGNEGLEYWRNVETARYFDTEDGESTDTF